MNELDSTCGISDDELTRLFKESIRIDNEIRRIKGLPVAKYDDKTRRAYLEYPDGRREYVGSNKNTVPEEKESGGSMIEQITDPNTKRAISRKVLEALHDWFAVDESREKYISESADQIFLAAKEDDEYVGFLCLKETGKETVELAVMGVMKEYHRKGLGRQLFEAAKSIAVKEGYSFMQVKTVQMGVYEDYDITNRFYLSCGFKEFEVIKELWGDDNPCQIYVMYLK